MATRSVSRGPAPQSRSRSTKPAPAEAQSFDDLYDRLSEALSDNEPARAMLGALVDLGFRAQPAEPQSRSCHPTATGYSEATAGRIRAFLASMRHLRGCNVADDDHYQDGRSVIERLALSADEENRPTLGLSSAECADALNFLGRSEPREPRDWWKDPENAPSHVVGFYLTLGSLEDSLRGGSGETEEAQPTFASGSAIAEAIEDQRMKLYRIEGALRCVADALNSESHDVEAAAGAVELAADEIGRINSALDRVNLLRTVREQQEAVEEAREVLAAEQVQS